MSSANPFDQLTETISRLIPDSADRLRGDFERNIKGVLEGGLKSMNLVTREEFDVQSAVLLKTREKLEALEKQVAELEQLIKSKEA
ncbi:MAG: accessory factor UbiK family protein [Thiotrichaceae bacterium]|nr:accessory factor UbiK family protein [Thiotrichaceae bacterium]